MVLTSQCKQNEAGELKTDDGKQKEGDEKYISFLKEKNRFVVASFASCLYCLESITNAQRLYFNISSFFLLT